MRKELETAAQEQGFYQTAFLPVKDLVFVKEYRVYCEENLCGNYDKIPNCPPACGTVEELMAKAKQYETAFVLQTVWAIDGLDKQEVRDAKQTHNIMTRAVVEAAEALGEKGLVMSAGPTKGSSCMSAYCVDVAKLAESCCMTCWFEEKKTAFFSLFLFHE